MAHYAYKDLLCTLPERITDKYDCDPDYDGDLWYAAAECIAELRQQREELLEVLKDVVESWHLGLKPSEDPAVSKAANDLIDKLGKL